MSERSIDLILINLVDIVFIGWMALSLISSLVIGIVIVYRIFRKRDRKKLTRALIVCFSIAITMFILLKFSRALFPEEHKMIDEQKNEYEKMKKDFCGDRNDCFIND